MRKHVVSLLLAGLANFGHPAYAFDPTGDWLVEDGDAHIRTVMCDGKLWGVVSWAQKPGKDAENPDPSLRERPTLGLPIILGMTPGEPNRWAGSIYNPENGKTYQATVTAKGANLLEVEGCTLRGWICSSEDWTRIKPPPWSVGSAPDADLCLRLGAGTGLPQEGGLK